MHLLEDKNVRSQRGDPTERWDRRMHNEGTGKSRGIGNESSCKT
jgi:hypothetical protein